MRQLLRITATFALALVFTAGMAFGQDANEATVDQTGDKNEATVLQEILGTAPNKTFLDQENGSEAFVFQLSRGAANVLTGFGGNDAFQKNGELEVNQQTTVGAMIRLNQVGGVADLDQVGSYHRIELRQGSGSEANIDQGAFREGPGSATGPSDGQIALVDQESGDFADVEQGEVGHDNNFLDLNQNNGSNSAIVEQVEAESGNEFPQSPNARPGPNNNVARLDQYGGSDAEVYQRGVQNRLSGTTGKGSFATQGNGSFLRLKQNGDKNWTALDQNSGRQVARLDQSGGSYAEVNQKNGGGTVANRLSGTTGKTSFATQNNSRLDLLQNGNNNWTAIDQFSEGNTANITQKGNGNTVTMKQGQVLP
ncbi:curlin repeat-containing protein [Salinibacter ruber]|uniref:curlin repeat-containing protein n=1 Tax=Salinibacter ruber TaxID=146919 RepID=UPI000E56E03B|nr:curlin repeat-containing protein [Salinibacter ruber]